MRLGGWEVGPRKAPEDWRTAGRFARPDGRIRKWLCLNIVRQVVAPGMAGAEKPRLHVRADALAAAPGRPPPPGAGALPSIIGRRREVCASGGAA